MVKKNNKIRERANEKGVMLWEIAEKVGCNDSNFSRKLRREFSNEEKARILNIIEEIAAEKAATVAE